MWRIHTVVFDLDDTLFAEAEFVRSGFSAVDAWLATTHGIFGFNAIACRLFTEGARGRIFDQALQQLGVHADPDLVGGMLRSYREHLPRLTLLPDAASCLRALEGRVTLALLSDGYLDVQQRKLTSLGIASRFASVIFTDALGRAAWKPSRVGFERILQDLGGCSAGFVYVADNPRKDFIAPRTLGWKTVRIRHANGEHYHYAPADNEAADCDIDDLTRLPSLFACTLDRT